jgi:hypothetical protein
LLDGVGISLIELCTRATHISRFIIDFNSDLFWEKTVLINELQDSIERHNFGKTGNLHNFLVIVASNDLKRRVLNNDETFRSNIAEISLRYVEKLFSFKLLYNFFSLLPLQLGLLHNSLLYPQFYFFLC